MDTSDPDLLPEGLEDRLPRDAATATRDEESSPV